MSPTPPGARARLAGAIGKVVLANRVTRAWMQRAQARESEAGLSDNERSSLLRSDKLRSSAMQFWSALGKDLDEMMDREEYGLVHRLIMAAMVPELTDDEAKEAADADWQQDLGVADEGLTGERLAELKMARDTFVDGMCLIATMSVSTADEGESVAFIERLFACVSTPTRAPSTGLQGAALRANQARSPRVFIGAARDVQPLATYESPAASPSGRRAAPLGSPDAVVEDDDEDRKWTPSTDGQPSRPPTGAAGMVAPMAAVDEGMALSARHQAAPVSTDALLAFLLATSPRFASAYTSRLSPSSGSLSCTHATSATDGGVELPRLVYDALPTPSRVDSLSPRAPRIAQGSSGVASQRRTATGGAPHHHSPVSTRRHPPSCHTAFHPSAASRPRLPPLGGAASAQLGADPLSPPQQTSPPRPVDACDLSLAKLQLLDRAARMTNPSFHVFDDVRLHTPLPRKTPRGAIPQQHHAFYSEGLHRSPRPARTPGGSPRASPMSSPRARKAAARAAAAVVDDPLMLEPHAALLRPRWSPPSYTVTDVA